MKGLLRKFFNKNFTKKKEVEIASFWNNFQLLMELILSTRHHIAGDCEKYELIDERLLEVDLDLVVWKDTLAFYEESAYLRLSNDIPPVFTILNYILYHFIIIRFKFVIFLIRV